MLEPVNFYCPTCDKPVGNWDVCGHGWHNECKRAVIIDRVTKYEFRPSDGSEPFSDQVKYRLKLRMRSEGKSGHMYAIYKSGRAEQRMWFVPASRYEFPPYCGGATKGGHSCSMCRPTGRNS